MFQYKKKKCFIKPIKDWFVGLNHMSPGTPSVQRYWVKGPGYVAWSPGIGKAFARRAKDARKLLQEAIDNQSQVVVVVKAHAKFVVTGAYRG